MMTWIPLHGLMTWVHYGQMELKDPIMTGLCLNVSNLVPEMIIQRTPWGKLLNI